MYHQPQPGPPQPGTFDPGPFHPAPPVADRRRHRRGVTVLMVTVVLACVPLAVLPFLFTPDGPQDYVRITFATNTGVVAAGMLAATLIGEFIAALVTRRPLARVCAGIALAMLLAVLLRLATL